MTAQQTDLRKVVVVLVEPSGPINVGSVARLCPNFGVSDLRMVTPRCNPMSSEAERMAVHGREHLSTARIHASLVEALHDCSRSVATCGRVDHGEIPLHSPESALSWLLEKPVQENKEAGPIALVFGREDRGLSNSELRLCQRVLSLHTCGGYPSLNLSHAVAIVLHELRRQQSKRPSSGLGSPDPAPAQDMDGFFNDAEELLLEAGFLLEHTASARMGKVRDLLQRATTRREEVALLRGMVRQLRWAIRSERP